jgi:hypothetical protein
VFVFPPNFLVEISSDLCGCFEGGKELEETPTIVVTSTTRTYELLCGVAEPRDKSCVQRACCCS